MVMEDNYYLHIDDVSVHIKIYLIAKSNPVPENPSLPVYPLGQGPHLLRKNGRKIVTCNPI